MEPLRMKLLHGIITVVCFHGLALAGDPNGRVIYGDDGGSNTDALSNAANDIDLESPTTITNQDAIIDPADFVSTIDNPYFKLTPGSVWIYEGKNDNKEKVRIEVEVTHDTKIVAGVTATVVRDRVWEDGELVEDTYDWYAQDKDGTVWYFGEDVKDYEDGLVVSTAGSWEAGVAGAKPGVMMKANPQVGDAYRQEFLKGQAEDTGQILSLSQSLKIGMGSFGNLLQTQDWTPLEPEVIEYKFYSKAVGNVMFEKKVAGDSGSVELIEYRTK